MAEQARWREQPIEQERHSGADVQFKLKIRQEEESGTQLRPQEPLRTQYRQSPQEQLRKLSIKRLTENFLQQQAVKRMQQVQAGVNLVKVLFGYGGEVNG